MAKVYSTFLPWQGDPVGDEGRRIHHSSNRPHKVDAGRPTVPRILTSRKVQIQGSTLLRHHFQHSCKDGTTGGNGRGHQHTGSHPSSAPRHDNPVCFSSAQISRRSSTKRTKVANCLKIANTPLTHFYPLRHSESTCCSTRQE